MLDPFCGIETNAPNLMIFLNGYFDESGKVHDHKQRVVSVGGFLARSFQWQGFHEKWMELLGTNGLKELKFTQAIRFRNPFGQKVSAVGRDARVKALLPFIHAARTSLEFGVVSTVNADAFRELSNDEQVTLQGDPYYVAFTSVMANIEKGIRERYVGEDVLVGIVFDFDSKTSVACLQMFMKMCANLKFVRDRFVSIGFGNSQHFTQLQLADLLAGTSRLAAEQRFFSSPFEMQPLYHEFNLSNPELAPVVGHFWTKAGLKASAHHKDPFGIKALGGSIGS